MGMRRDGRMVALQVLYGLDLCGDWGALAEALRRPAAIEEEKDISEEARAFAHSLCRGVVERLAEIDRAIARAADHWRIERMNPVDRNVLRVAVYELLLGQTAAAVVIDEAIELARAFGSSESARFVNGVLAALSEDGAASLGGPGRPAGAGG